MEDTLCFVQGIMLLKIYSKFISERVMCVMGFVSYRPDGDQPVDGAVVLQAFSFGLQTDQMSDVLKVKQ